MLPEVQRVCDRVAFVREGELVAVEDVAELMGKAVREIEVVFAEPVAPSAFEGVPGVTSVGADGKDAATLRLTVTGSLDPVVKRLGAYPVVDLISQLPDLEDVFMTFYAGEGDDPMLRDPVLQGAARPAAPVRRCGPSASPSTSRCSSPSTRASGRAPGRSRSTSTDMPEAIKAAFMARATSRRPSGYVNVELLSWLAPIVLIGFAVAVAARSLAGEEESGTLGRCSRTPWGGGGSSLQKYAAMVVVVVALGAVFWLSLGVATAIAGTPVGAGDLAQAFVGSTLLGLAIGSVTYAVSAATGAGRPASRPAPASACSCTCSTRWRS